MDAPAVPAADAANRLSTIDYLRAYAIILVVLVHASGPPLYAFNDVPRGTWWTANLFDSFARPCVPLFVMISGFLLLDSGKDESLGTFFRKRFSKVLIPYFFWASFYIWWRWAFHGEHFNIGVVTRELLAGTSYYHLVFMNIILGLYLMTPMLRVFVKYANQGTKIYTILLWFVLASFIPFFTKMSNFAVNGYLQVTPLFMGHFLLGSYFKTTQIRLRRKHYVALGAALGLVVAATAVLTYVYTKKQNGILDDYFYCYGSPNIVLMSVISYVLMAGVFAHPAFLRLPILPALLRRISATSFGIYLTHVVVLECLQRGTFGFRLTQLTFNPLISIPLTTAIVVLVCGVVMHYVQKVPYVRGLVP